MVSIRTTAAVMAEIESELNALGYRTPRSNADYADESQLYIVELREGFTIAAVRLEADRAKQPYSCSTCDGYGYVISVHSDPFGNPPEREADPCPECGGGSTDARINLP